MITFFIIMELYNLLTVKFVLLISIEYTLYKKFP